MLAGSVEAVVTALLTALLLWFWKPWAGAYATEKGRNLARKEDLDPILSEVRAVATVQREIEAKISGDLWNAQMHWTQKRDMYVALLKNITDLRDSYNMLNGALQFNALPEVARRRAEVFAQTTEFARLHMLARIFATPACDAALTDYIRQRSAMRNRGTADWANEEATALTGVLNRIVPIAQSDLGVRSGDGGGGGE